MSLFGNKEKKCSDKSAAENEAITDVDENLPYSTPLEHLMDELRWLNRKIAIRVMQLRVVNFYEEIKDFRHLFITDKEVDELLGEECFGATKQQHDESQFENIIRLQQLAQTMRNYVNNRVLVSMQQDQILPLVQLKNLFGLSALDIEILVICIAPHFDTRYERLYAYLQNDINKSSPGKDLIIGLLETEDKSKVDYISAFDINNPLFYYEFLTDAGHESGPYSVNKQYQIDPRFVHYVLRQQTLDEQLIGILQFLPSLPWEEVIVANEFKKRMQQFIQYELAKLQDACLYLHGPAGVGKKTIARALCSDVQILFAKVDLRELMPIQDKFEFIVKRVLREGILQPCGVCFDHIEVLEKLEIEQAGITKKFIQLLQETSWLTFLCSENPLPPAFVEMTRIYPVEVLRPVYEQQVSLWELYLDKINVPCDLIDIAEIVSTFNLNGGQIKGAIQQAEKFAHILNPENSHLIVSDLKKCCRLQSQPKLMSLAKKIEPQYSWQDLILQEDQMAQLQEMANQVNLRHKVLNEWGFAGKISLGLGINALFSGASGTGKTMAAEVIGHELNLDIYKIDLSTVVSKYIGETEKNLNRLFVEAEHSNSILFFDEADAIFGKRSEVKDAHDRFANIEVAYLLQKMEEYQGITILSTNFKKNLDPAFVRRLQFIINFSLPDEEQREKIWRQIFPSLAPLDNDINFSLLAGKFKIAGGNIKNIGIRSAYLAAHDDVAISMKHVVLATKRELQKVGIIFTETEFL